MLLGHVFDFLYYPNYPFLSCMAFFDVSLLFIYNLVFSVCGNKGSLKTAKHSIQFHFFSTNNKAI